MSAVPRVPAGNVLRIEIVDAATLNIAGLTGQVANVVVRTTGISGQYPLRPALSHGVAGPRLTRFDASVSGRAGPVTWTPGARNDDFREAPPGRRRSGPPTARSSSGARTV